jgi:hypothetical protein
MRPEEPMREKRMLKERGTRVRIATPFPKEERWFFHAYPEQGTRRRVVWP